MQGDHPIPEKVIEKFAGTGSEICRDVFLLSKVAYLPIVFTSHVPMTVGKSGLLTTSHGLRIACLGGLYDENVFESVQTPLVSDFFKLTTGYAEFVCRVSLTRTSPNERSKCWSTT